MANRAIIVAAIALALAGLVSLTLVLRTAPSVTDMPSPIKPDLTPAYPVPPPPLTVYQAPVPPNAALPERSQPSTPSAAPTSEPVARAVRWKPIKSWTGSGIKTTEPFGIDKSPWLIAYRLRATREYGAYLGICVYDSDKLSDVAVNTQSEGANTTYVYTTGTTHLGINGMGNWAVTVYVQD